MKKYIEIKITSQKLEVVGDRDNLHMDNKEIKKSFICKTRGD